MTENYDIDYDAMSDERLISLVGNFIKHHRIEKNIEGRKNDIVIFWLDNVNNEDFMQTEFARNITNVANTCIFKNGIVIYTSCNFRWSAATFIGGKNIHFIYKER